MNRLNERMFFKVKFSMSARDRETDLLWEIIMKLKDWQVRKCRKRGAKLTGALRDWSQLKWGGRLNAEDESALFFSDYLSLDNESSQRWACKIIENLAPPKGRAFRQWVTEIGFQQKGQNLAEISCVVSYSDRAGFIGPYQEEPPLCVPNLIRNIAQNEKLTSFCGPDYLTEDPYELKIGDWPEFRKKIDDSQRELSYIYISPQIVDEDNNTKLLVNPKKLAKTLLGNARVFYSMDPNFSKEMSYMNQEYACYGGGIRVYQANTSDPDKHRYLTADNIQELGEDQVWRILVRAFAQNSNFYESFFGLDECKKEKDDYFREKRSRELQEKHKMQLQNVENEGINLASEEEYKREMAELELEEVKKQLDDKKKENFEMQARVNQISEIILELNSLREVANTRQAISEIPNSVEAVMQYFSSAFADKLAVSDRAWKSLKDCTLDPAEVWKVLFALANDMVELYRCDSQGDIFKKFRQKTGIEASRSEGRMTRKDAELMKQFEVEYKGEKISIEPHVTYPKQKQSIHFGYSSKSKRVIIGHCGKHMEIYSTRKVS